MLRRLAGGLGALALIVLAIAARPLPPELLDPPAGAAALDRSGAVIGTRYRPEEAAPLAPGDYSPALIEATLAAEDHRFRWHIGLDPLAIVRAIWVDLRAGAPVEGASTITQQLAKDLLGPGPRSLGRKLSEAELALRLEWSLSKDAILARYLSRVGYGHGARGAERAARVYFGKSARGLALHEAALLAALPRRPSALDPWRHPEAARRARRQVLARMLRCGMIDEGERALADGQPLGLVDAPGERAAPHYARHLLDGAAPGSAVPGTLDLALQRRVEAIVSEQLGALAEQRVQHAAVIVAELESRDVLAWVGSGDWSAGDGQVDGVRAPRSPGSALKPFLYELALERGATLAELLPDLPSSYGTTHGSYQPSNYDGTWSGPVRLGAALARSLNAPAIALARRVGAASLRGRLEALGVSTLVERPAHYGLGLALGGGEVRLDELTAAYAALGDGGIYRPLRLRADDPHPPGRAVMDPGAAWLTLMALSDDGERAPTFGRGGVLATDFPAAVKTGTSTGWRDNWTVGLTPELVVGVWVGNFDGSEMADVSGVSGAGPIWRAVMTEAMRGRPERDFPAPAGARRVPICPLSGMAPGPHCPRSHSLWFLAGTAPTDACTWHRADGLAAPAPYGAWAAASGLRLSADTAPSTPAVRSPADDSRWFLDLRRPAGDQAIPLRADAPSGAGEATWYVDGAPVARGPAGEAQRWIPSPGEHHITVALGDRRSPPVRIWVGAAPED